MREETLDGASLSDLHDLIASALPELPDRDLVAAWRATAQGGPYRVRTNRVGGGFEQYVAWVEPRRYGEPKMSTVRHVARHLAACAGVNPSTIVQPGNLTALIGQELWNMARYPRELLSLDALTVPLSSETYVVTRDANGMRISRVVGGSRIEAAEVNRWMLMCAVSFPPTRTQLCCEISFEELNEGLRAYYGELAKVPERESETLFVKRFGLDTFVDATIGTFKDHSAAADTNQLEEALGGASASATVYYHDYSDDTTRRGSVRTMLEHVLEGTVIDDVYVWVPEADIMIYISHHDFFRILHLGDIVR